MKIEVAGIVIRLDISDRFLGETIYKFHSADLSQEGFDEDVLIEVSYDSFPLFPEFEKKKSPVHHVYAFNNNKYYLFSAADYVTYIKYDADCSYFILNLNKGELVSEEYIEAVNSALRRIFLMIIAARGGVSLHSSTVGLSGEAICFSACSGTGKTTHTNLWRKYIHGTEILNGDKGYLFLRDEKVYFFSAPWCGTSGDLIKTEAPVKAVVFLSQAPYNKLSGLSVPEVFMNLLTGCFLPAWDMELYLKAIDTVETLAAALVCYRLKCLPDEEAVRTCYHGIYVAVNSNNDVHKS